MKLRKAKRFNTIESYASCVCLYATCSCSCGACSCTGGPQQSNKVSTLDRTGQSIFDREHYNYQDVYIGS